MEEPILQTVGQGALAAVMLASVATLAILSPVLLTLFRRASKRGMLTIAGVRKDPPPVPSVAPPKGRLEVRRIGEADDFSAHEEAASQFQRMKGRLRSAVGVYALAGVGYAVIFAVAWSLLVGGGFVASRFLILLLYFTWPLLLTVGIVGTASRSERWRLRVGLLGTFLVVMLILSTTENPSFRPTLLLWFLINGPATLAFLLTQHRPIRSFGLLVLALTLFAFAGALLAFVWLQSQPSALEGYAAFVFQLGLSAEAALGLALGVGFVALGILAWPTWRLIGAVYRAKWVSTQMLHLDALWLTFALFHGVLLLPSGWQWGAVGLLAFVVYWGVTRLGFALLSRTSSPAPRLLLLRVFALGSRSEGLFDQFTKGWLRLGSIQMIAGPDLLSKTIEPQEFMQFVSGRHGERFVTSHEEVERGLQAIDLSPDADGRYRTTEFFCHHDTWEPMMQGLAKESEVVLMDLRRFGPDNEGCRYELKQLLSFVPLQRVLLVLDLSTDDAFLESLLMELWATIPEDSPNYADPNPTLSALVIERQDRKTIHRLLELLTEASIATKTSPISG